ncbi:MAG: hypothetical protein V4649_02680 [Bacteroidota bacterium]
MKKLNIIIASVLLLSGLTATAQKQKRSEKYGHALNLGVGIGYYGYIGHSLPVLHADYEFDVAKNFTLAPFINYFSYTNHNYWGDPGNPYKNYSYRETVIPIGVKGTYYFDRILGAGSKWDFYLAGSLGFAIRRTTWETGYYGSKTIKQGTGALYADLHVGTEYHFNKKVGMFLDLSTGVSTLGLGIHI